MRLMNRILSSLIGIAMLAGLISPGSFSGYASSNLAALNLGVWAVEYLGGQEYSINLSMYDPGAPLPSGALSVEDLQSIRSIWVEDPSGKRIGNLDIERQIVTQAQNRMILENQTDWILDGEINSQDIGPLVPHQNFNLFGDSYFFDVRMPSPFNTSSTTCRDVFFSALYLGVPGGFQYEGHRKSIYREIIKALVFPELTESTYDEFLDQFYARFGKEFNAAFAATVGAGGDYAALAAGFANAIEGQLFLSGNIDGLQAYGRGLETFRDGMYKIENVLATAEVASTMTKDAFEGFLLHAYANGIAAERMQSLLHFAINASSLNSRVDPALIDAIYAFDHDFNHIVRSEFEAVLSTVANNWGEYAKTGATIVAQMAMHGWGYFGIGLKALILLFEYLYGRDDVIRTIAGDLTLQDQLQEYLELHVGSIPTREALLLNSIKHYLSYHYYTVQADRTDIFTDFLCWDPGMTKEEYISYIEAESAARAASFYAYGHPDFLAAPIAGLITEKLNVPSIVDVSPNGPLTVIKPETVPLHINVNDAGQITRVDFRSGPHDLGSDTDGADGWSLDWHTANYPGGQYLIEITAVNDRGISSVVTVQINLIDLGYSADLGVSGLYASPTNPEVGEQVSFNVDVQNWSDHTLTDAPVVFYVDEQAVDSSTVALDPGQSTSVSGSWVATYGAHNVRVTAELPFDENPANDNDTLVIGSVEPGLLQVAGTSTPGQLFFNLEPGTTSDHTIVLRNAGDIGLNVSASAVSPSNGSITLLSSSPFFIPAQSFFRFDYRVGMSSGAPVGGEYDGSITFTSPGGDVLQGMTVKVVDSQQHVESSLSMPAGWVDEDPNYYSATVDVSAYQDRFLDGLDYAHLSFTADNVDTCPGGYCNFTVYVLDGAWFPCSGSASFQPGDVPIQLQSTCGHNLGRSSITYRIVANGGSRFHIDPVSYDFRVYDGDPNLSLTRQITPSTINIDQTATVQLIFENIGTNEARDPTYDENPLPYNLSLVSGTLSGEAPNLDPGDLESVSYVVEALQPGEYTFPSTTSVYYNATKSHVYESSFDTSTLTVLGGTLQPAVSFDEPPHYMGQSRTIYADVTDSLTGETVSGAEVLATVTSPSAQTYGLQLLYDEELDLYVGMFHNTHELGAYSVHVSATGPYYTSGATSTDPEFTVVTPFSVDVIPASTQPVKQPFFPSLVNFDLENTGAAGDTVELSVTNLPAGWEWGMTPGITTLDSGQSITGAVTVRPLASAGDGDYQVAVEAISKGDPAIGDTETLGISLDGSPPVVESLLLEPASIVPGDTLTLTLDLDESASIEVDYADFDSNWDSSNVVVSEIDAVNHIYTASYQVTAGTAIGDGHYHARIKAVDAAGNALGTISNDVWLERNSPWLEVAAPGDSVDAPFGTQIRMYFSEPMDQISTSSAFSIAPPIEGSLTWGSESALVFAPNEYLLPETTYTVTIGSGARDAAGNALASTSWSFTILPIERILEVPIGLGWNLITLPFGPEIGLQTAEEICSELAAEGAVPAEVARWYAGGWDSHICGLSFNNFTLEYGQGVFVRAGGSLPWEVSGIPLQSALDINLSTGWNLVGMPYGVAHTAETAGQEINGQGGSCVEVDRWYAGGWDSHIIGLPFNEFDLLPGEGYFIRCDGPSVWSLSP